MIVHLNGRLLPKAEARISPDDRGFLFADGAYEVIRSYDGRLFRAEAHLARMARSLGELRIDGPAPDDLLDVVRALIEANNLARGQAVVYLQVTRGVAPRKHAFPDDPVPPTVYAYAAPFTPTPEKAERGVRVLLLPDIRWTRCDIKSVALLPNVLARQQAQENGAEESVFVRDGALTEGALTNVCAVFDGTLVTHPESHYILGGVTRAVVLDLCRALGVAVREVPILEKDLRAADEVLLTGTTTDVMPVVQVDGWTVGDGTPGPITRRLQHAFREQIKALDNHAP